MTTAHAASRKDEANAAAKSKTGRKPAAKDSRPALCALPFCSGCGLHIGTGAVPGMCGVCMRGLAKAPVELTRPELMRAARLVRKHWGDGRLRSLLNARNATPEGYRPNFVVRASEHWAFQYSDKDCAELLAACVERAQLADLYDRLQFMRGDSRRAVRS